MIYDATYPFQIDLDAGCVRLQVDGKQYLEGRRLGVQEEAADPDEVVAASSPAHVIEPSRNIM